MDSIFRGESAKTDDAAPHSPNQHPNPSSSELFSSAKLVADAAKAKLQNKEFDQAKAADAAADLLNTGSHYGKLEEDKGLGKIVNQAEDYLHKYQTSNTTSNLSGHSTTPATTHETTHTTTHPSGDEHGQSGGGYGDYVKMAEGFLKKQSGDNTPHDSSTTGGHPSAHSEGGNDNSDSGYGEYFKMAGDFLKKN